MEPKRVIERLEPLLLPRRVARMRAVLATRSDQAAFGFERMVDPHNLSAALRSLDAFSFQDAHWIEPGERLGLSHLITRGTERWLTLHAHPSAAACVAALHGQGYRVLASHVGGGEPLEALDFSRRTALLFGNEHAGVSPELAALADGSFHIPMQGFAESLNLSVAVAISAHHARGELQRLERQAKTPGAYALTPGRQLELYAAWLRASVRRADAVLAEAGPAQPHE